MAENVSENVFMRFRKTTAAKVIGCILAIVAGILLFYGDAIQWCCVGVLLIGIVVFMVLKIFDVSNFKILIVVGVLFLLISTAVGAVVSKPVIDNSVSSFNSNGFNDVEVITENGHVTIYVDYSGDKTLDKVTVSVGEMSFISYKLYNYVGSDGNSSYAHDMTYDGDRYRCELDLGKEKVYGFKFTGEYKDGDNTAKVTTGNGLFKNDAEGFGYIKILLKGNLYYCGLATLMYMAIILFTEWSKRNIEKSKAKLAAEGKGIPQGYGRCKECNSIILPGEKHCRKCGALVDEQQLKPVNETKIQDAADYFECSDCGARVPADAKVCPKCGAKFDEDE